VIWLKDKYAGWTNCVPHLFMLVLGFKPAALEDSMSRIRALAKWHATRSDESPSGDAAEMRNDATRRAAGRSPWWIISAQRRRIWRGDDDVGLRYWLEGVGMKEVVVVGLVVDSSSSWDWSEESIVGPD
jgi:hypothetical protein